MTHRTALSIATATVVALALAGLPFPGVPSVLGAQASELKIEMRPRVARIVDRPLVAADGKPVRFLRDLVARQPVLLSFTFVGCVQLCPPSDIVMDGVAQKLEQGGRNDVRLVTITLDPLSDTPERLFAERASKMHPARLFLSGDPNHVWAVLDGLGIQAGPNQNHDIEFLVIGIGGRTINAIPGIPSPDAVYAALPKTR